MRISDCIADVCAPDLRRLEAFHPGAAKALRQARTPLRIKNTFEPDDPGAAIRGDLAVEAPAVEIITGLKGVYAFEFFEQDMVGVKGYDAAILETLKRHRVQIVEIGRAHV